MYFNYSQEKKIYYEVSGSGVPIIFLPGWSMDHSVFQYQKDCFQKDFQVILIDPPGCGESARFEEYSIDQYADVVKKLLIHLEIEQAHFVGWSLGGEVLLQLLKLKIGVIKSATLVCSTPCFVKREDWQFGMDNIVARKFLKNLKRDSARTFELFREDALNSQKADPQELEKAVQLLIKAGRGTDLNNASDMFKELMAVDIRPGLESIEQPVNIFFSSEDIICRPEASRYMKEQLRGGQLIDISGGHVPFIIDKDNFNKVMLDYI